MFQNVPEIERDTNAGWKVRETGVSPGFWYITAYFSNTIQFSVTVLLEGSCIPIFKNISTVKINLPSDQKNTLGKNKLKEAGAH